MGICTPVLQLGTVGSSTEPRGCRCLFLDCVLFNWILQLQTTLCHGVACVSERQLAAKSLLTTPVVVRPDLHEDRLFGNHVDAYICP